MAGTPVNSRLLSPWGLRLTPSNNSPHSKSPLAKSPTKTSKHEFNLSLKRVIGTTAVSANAFDGIHSNDTFAFTAGAAAVLVTVESDYSLSQKFYRARPTTAPVIAAAPVHPSTPTNPANESRYRAAALREGGGGGGSPFGSPAGDRVDSPGRGSWNIRERVKSATCVSLSRDGKYLAVGETGYKPRVLIFSLAPEASVDTPLTMLPDHTFGVRSVAFSPDSRYLASLGASNDGFLYIWNIHPKTGAATLFASNKCTSHIMQMAWLGSALVTVGTRHVKIWRTEEQQVTSPTVKTRLLDNSIVSSSPANKTLPGRNCILGIGNLLESTFVSVCAVASSKALVCSDRGDICLLDDSECSQRFEKLCNAGFSITSAAIDSHDRLHVSGRGGQFLTLKVQGLTSGGPQPPCVPFSPQEKDTMKPYFEALACLSSTIATVDSSRDIKLLRLPEDPQLEVSLDAVKRLPSHGGPVLGVQSLVLPNVFNSSFMTWAANGEILLWNSEGELKETVTLELDQPDDGDGDRNELKVVRALPEATSLATGDRYGVFRVIDSKSRKVDFELKAHAGEITDITIQQINNATYAACSSRDRTVQVFTRSSSSWDLLQTLDEHVGAVTCVLFANGGNKLLSASADRTVVVRDLATREEDGQTMAAFIILRTITLKATPAAMTMQVNQDDTLIVSTIDRNVHKYDIKNGQLTSTFRTTDFDSSDTVVLTAMMNIPSPRGPPLLAGISGTDKSIRIYDDSGTLVRRDWGHTEGVTDLTVVAPKNEQETDSDETSLVSVAADGTTFMWSLFRKGQVKSQDLAKAMDLLSMTPPEKETLVTKPPLRRVFSQSELARFQRRSSADETTTPTGSRSPVLRKRSSRFSLAQTPKLDPPGPNQRFGGQSNSPPLYVGTSNRYYRTRSPSPPSPRSRALPKSRRQSVDARSKTGQVSPTAVDTGFGSLAASTEQVCRTLRAYRKKLSNSADSLSSGAVKELEKELAATARALGEKAVKSRGLDETVMVKLLDSYSEKLVEMLDEKIAASVARQVQQSNETDEVQSGKASPSKEMDSIIECVEVVSTNGVLNAEGH